ncbi:hypothetical protein [Nonomuraea sp. NEAU-A123]|uniref:hypothetical protein n=1 Tax=Nonomuraea sp. NEAU-A123 TaxID=2839649 RepID=UPI001BE41112|nr:hypothetical protein [Nonomuraea sp. NEAU-A123]MBT2229186.1 hypothetical protein [Nonomuraea sp. NEAU-A123]
MCGACGERGDADWARPWVAGPGARAAVARAVTQVRPSPGVRVLPSVGGWLVVRPTGGTVVCATLGELVGAVRSASSGSVTGPDASRPSDGEARAASSGSTTWLDPARPSGRLSAPAPDGRTGVVLRVDPLAPPRAALGEGSEVVVPNEVAALAVLAELATPVWLRRLYLARIEGVSALWGRPVDSQAVPSPGSAADAVVRLEWERQAGRFDDTAFALSCPLDDDAALLDVEIRAGHVVRARTIHPYEITGSAAC